MSNVPWWVWGLVILEAFGVLAYVLSRFFGKSSLIPSMDISDIHNPGLTQVDADWTDKFPYDVED